MVFPVLLRSIDKLSEQALGIINDLNPPEDRRPPDICGRKPTGSTLKTKTPLGRQMLIGQGRFHYAKERTEDIYSGGKATDRLAVASSKVRRVIPTKQTRRFACSQAGGIQPECDPKGLASRSVEFEEVSQPRAKRLGIRK